MTDYYAIQNQDNVPDTRPAPDHHQTDDRDDSDSRTSGDNVFASVLGRYPVFMGSNGNPYIGIDEGNSQALQIGHKPTNIFLRQLYAAQSGNRLKPNELKAINEELMEYAELSGDVRDVFYRVARTEDGIELDFGDNLHTRIRIREGRVQVIKEGSATYFYRTRDMLPYAFPADRGDLKLLNRYLNVDDPSKVLLIAWITYTLAHSKLDTTNFLFLVLQGDQGSGKSLLCKILKALIDPSIIGVQTFPQNGRDLAIASRNAHVLIFDNIRKISSTMADKLCIASTGGTLPMRKLYTDDEQQVLWLHVALVLNGIHDFVDQPDLAQRCLPLLMRTFDEKDRLSEAAILQAFHADLPRIFRGLLDLIAEIMTHLPSVEVTNPERMIEFVRWLAAMEKVFGAPAGVFQMQYSSALNEGMLESLQENPLAAVVMAFAEDLPEGQVDRNSHGASEGTLLAHRREFPGLASEPHRHVQTSQTAPGRSSTPGHRRSDGPRQRTQDHDH